jgi:hypothetical protein
VNISLGKRAVSQRIAVESFCCDQRLDASFDALLKATVESEALASGCKIVMERGTRKGPTKEQKGQVVETTHQRAVEALATPAPGS